MDECCPQLDPSISHGEAERLAGVLKVLADPARLRILSLLAGSREVCVCDLTEPLGLTQPTISHHLKQLRRVGLLESERRGKWVYHRVVGERLDEVRRALDLPVTV